MKRVLLLLLFVFLAVPSLQAQDEAPPPDEEVPAEAPAEEAPDEVETPAEAPAEEAPDEETEAEAPAEEASAEVETPAEAPAEAALEESPAEAPAEAALEESPAEVPAEAEVVAEVPVEAPAEEAKKDPLAALQGYKVGINVGYPVISGEAFDYLGIEPVFGLVVATPYGMPIGPFDVGFNAGLESANGMFGFFAVANATVYNLPQGPISVFAGAGILNSLGIVGGASFDYAVPNQPILVKPYVRANIALTGGGPPPDNSKPTGWIQIGAMVTYSIN